MQSVYAFLKIVFCLYCLYWLDSLESDRTQGREWEEDMQAKGHGLRSPNVQIVECFFFIVILCPFTIVILQCDWVGFILTFYLHFKHTVRWSDSVHLRFPVNSCKLLSIPITPLSGHGIDFQCLAFSRGAGEPTGFMLVRLVTKSRAPPSGVKPED